MSVYNQFSANLKDIRLMLPLQSFR